jgi:hypothetical protein
MGERRGADWKNVATHARFTSNPDENIAGFLPGGLKRLEMLLVFLNNHIYLNVPFTKSISSRGMRGTNLGLRAFAGGAWRLCLYDGDSGRGDSRYRSTAVWRPGCSTAEEEPIRQDLC